MADIDAMRNIIIVYPYYAREGPWVKIIIRLQPIYSQCSFVRHQVQNPERCDCFSEVGELCVSAIKECWRLRNAA